MDVLRVKNVEGIKTEWNASPDEVADAAKWFFPFLEGFIYGVSSLADNYVIEGVDFLPMHVNQLSIHTKHVQYFRVASK